MKKIFILFLFLPGFALGAAHITVLSAEKCQTLPCVRNQIDSIDKEIVKLIGLRLKLVKRAGELKPATVSVHDQARENKILNTVSVQATAFGYPPEIARAIFRTILQQSNQYEIQYHSSR